MNLKHSAARTSSTDTGPANAGVVRPPQAAAADSRPPLDLDPRNTVWKALPGGIQVNRYNIIGTDTWIYRAWESTRSLANPEAPQHSTITTSGGPDTPPGQWLGTMGTRHLTPELAALPADADHLDARIQAVSAYHKAQYDLAYEAILQAFPEAAQGMRDMGSIEVLWPNSGSRRPERSLGPASAGEAIAPKGGGRP